MGIEGHGAGAEATLGLEFSSLPRRGRDPEAAADFAGGDEDDFGVAGDGLAFAGAGVPVEQVVGVPPAFLFERAAMAFEDDRLQPIVDSPVWKPMRRRGVAGGSMS